jgi:hypothetical protein
MIWQEDSPCWSARCDGCGEGVGHFDTEAEAVDELEAVGWYVCEGAVYCTMCALEMFDRMRNLRDAWLN